MKTQEAVHQERQGTTATGLGHREAAREAFCEGKGGSEWVHWPQQCGPVTDMSSHGHASEPDRPKPLPLQPGEQQLALENQRQTHHKEVRHVVELGAPGGKMGKQLLW